MAPSAPGGGDGEGEGIAADVGQGEGHAGGLGDDGGQGGPGGVEAEHPNKEHIQHHIHQTGDEDKEEGRAGVAHTPENAANAVVGGDEHDARRADADIGHRLTHGGLRDIHQPGSLGGQEQHGPGEHRRHQGEEPNLAAHHLTRPLGFSGAHGLAHQHGDAHGQTCNNGGDGLHHLAARGHGGH